MNNILWRIKFRRNFNFNSPDLATIEGTKWKKNLSSYTTIQLSYRVFVASRLIAEFWIAERKKKIFFLYLFDDADATLNAKFVDVT